VAILELGVLGIVLGGICGSAPYTPWFLQRLKEPLLNLVLKVKKGQWIKTLGGKKSWRVLVDI
jgi:hypothetical protein